MNYESVLNECSFIAQTEYRDSINKLRVLKNDLNRFQNNIITTILKLENSQISDKKIFDSINSVNDKTTNLLTAGFREFQKSFDNKSKNLSSFTITLFGRTKAGKSTIREALTNGNGNTIGKGAQRTTRDVKEYNWNNLRILDTPGFEAYDGEEDEKIAFSHIDETDLILFLITSDSIQEAEFEKLAQLRRENKPVIILMNVKYDLKHPIKRKMIINNPEKFVSKKAIQGHLSRLNELSRKHFNISNIPIIPIHALAAFESNKLNGNEKQKLYNVSNFDYLKQFLVKEITTTGKYKRVQTFRDSYVAHLDNSIKSIYIESFNQLNPVVKTLRKKRIELQKWFDKFIPDSNQKIEKKIDKLFMPLFNNLSTFIDNNITKDNFGELWQKEINKYFNAQKVENLQNEIMIDMNRYLDKFFKEFQYDLNFAINKTQKHSISKKEKSNTKTLGRWGSAISSVGGGIIISTAVANSWNPVGWALLGVSALISIFSWFGESDVDKFEREKKETKEKMKENLEEIKRKNKGAVKHWFYQNITRGLKKKIKKDLAIQVKSFEELLKEYKFLINKIDSIIEIENIELINKLVSLKYPINKNYIESMFRVQGEYSKIVVNDVIFRNYIDNNFFKNVYGEKIIVIDKDNDKIKFLLNVLNISYKEVLDITFNNNQYNLSVFKKHIGKVIGYKGLNIKSAEKLLKIRINIKEVR